MAKNKKRQNKYTKVHFIADGMTCPSCEKIIKKAALKVKGVRLLKIDYTTQRGIVVFDREKTDINEIFSAIEKKGYSCEEAEAASGSPKLNLKSIVLGVTLIISIFAALSFSQTMTGTEFMVLGEGASFVLLFILGLFTGLHCIGMCGGFVMSYIGKSAATRSKKRNMFSHVQYAFGKTASYAIIGALFGFIGSVFIFTPMMRGIAGIAAGIFLVIYGLNVLNAVPILRKVRIPVPKRFAESSINKTNKGRSPVIIGLLNGLMIACGPLQALYIYAAGTGSPIQGATSLFAFGLGTLPFLMGFGMFASFMSRKMAHNILKVSGVIVIVLGLIMLNRGLTLTGTGYDFNSVMMYTGLVTVNAEPEDNTIVMNNGYQEIRMEVNRYGWSPDKFILKKGVPVKWIIDGKEINGCNNAINVPAYNLEFDINPGEQVIEFTPEKSGVVPWSCWMGMIPGTFVVVDEINPDNIEEIEKKLDAVELPQAGSCGGSCGRPTCGAAAGGGCGCGARR